MKYIVVLPMLLVSLAAAAQRPADNLDMDSLIKANSPFSKDRNPFKNRQPSKYTGGAQPADAMDDLPKKNIANQYRDIPVLNIASLTTLAKTVLSKALAKLDPPLKDKLDKLVADTSVNTAGTGVFLLESGLPRYAGEYMISRGVIANPKDRWAVNDLGAVFRGYKMYKEAVQCYSYCVRLADSSAIFNTNLGWATAYYGDFEAAKRFFNKAVAINDRLASAWEGLGTIAYIEGNTAVLFQCLAKQIKGIGGGGNGTDGGPSASMIRLCGGVQMQSIDLSGKDETDPTANDTFDAGSGNEDDGDEPAANANDEPPAYPSMKPIFIKDIGDLGSALAVNYPQRFSEEQRRLDGIHKQKQQLLPPMPQPPYLDAGGNRIIPHNYQKWVQLYGDVDVLFDQRIAWVMKQYQKKMEKLVGQFGNEEYDMLQGYTNDMKACGGDDGCVKRVLCTWIGKFRTTKNADLAAASGLWSIYHNKILYQVNWFISATSPFIRKVHQPAWNDLLNFERERKVRLTILAMYNKWMDALAGVNNSGGLTALINANPNPECKIEAPGMESGDDPTTKKIKKLKTFAGPCYKEPTEIPLGIGKYTDDCDKTRIEFGNDEFKQFFEKNYSRKFKEDDYYKSGLTVGMSESIKGEIGEGVKLKGKAELSASATFFKKYDSNGDITEEGREVDLSATATARVETGVKQLDDMLVLKKGVSVHMVVSTMVGQNQTPDYRIRELSAEKISAGF